MKKLFVLVLACFASISVFSQEALKSIEEEYYDFLSLQGIVERPTLGYRTLSDSVWEIPEDAEHIWENVNLGSKKNLWESENQGDNWFTQGFYHGVNYKIFGPEWFNSYNTAAPYGQNDGALWQGRGYNTSLSSGFMIEGFGVEVTLKPQISWSQNLDYSYLPGVYGSEYSYFWAGSIDLVQRYGNSSLFQYDWGDSEVRYTFRKFTVGFGTESPWLGPAHLNPMLGSNNAGTYPKLDFGFKKTDLIIPGLGWNLGQFESRIWIGQLTESDYFNNDGIKDKNLINGFNISYSPSFWPEFTVGATKVCLTRWGNNFWKYMNPFYSSNDINGIGEDQKCSVYFDILFPKVLFEFYSEIGLDDYSSNLLSNPFHTLTYSIGFKKEFINNGSLFQKELILEISNNEMSQDFQLQWGYIGYYGHGSISEGLTQNGQLISAGTGYHGNSQILIYNIYNNKTAFSFFIHRHSPDTNYIYNKAVGNSDLTNLQNVWWAKNKTYLTLGFSNSLFISDYISIKSGVNGTYILYNTYQDKSDVINVNLNLTIKYLIK